jgi:hypothetical protein
MPLRLTHDALHTGLQVDGRVTWQRFTATHR